MPGPPTQGSSVRKISPYKFWQQKPVELSQGKKILVSQAVPLKEPTHELTQTYCFLAPALGEQHERYQWLTGRN